MATPVPARNPRKLHVRVDMTVGAALIVLAALSRLVWLASDTGWLDGFGTR